jgi:hypothetical protein
VWVFPNRIFCKKAGTVPRVHDLKSIQGEYKKQIGDDDLHGGGLSFDSINIKKRELDVKGDQAQDAVFFCFFEKDHARRTPIIPGTLPLGTFSIPREYRWQNLY